MCDDCKAQVQKARDEILTIMNGGAIDCMLDEDGPESWTEAAKMAIVISRAAVIIQNTENGLTGAPLSMIIGSVAGVAMEAEMMSHGLNEFLAGIMNPESLN